MSGPSIQRLTSNSVRIGWFRLNKGATAFQCKKSCFSLSDSVSPKSVSLMSFVPSAYAKLSRSRPFQHAICTLIAASEFSTTGSPGFLSLLLVKVIPVRDHNCFFLFFFLFFVFSLLGSRRQSTAPGSCLWMWEGSTGKKRACESRESLHLSGFLEGLIAAQLRYRRSPARECVFLFGNLLVEKIWRRLTTGSKIMRGSGQCVHRCH